MSSKEWIFDHLPGAIAFTDWFGVWTDFHDAEILEVHLSRAADSWIKLHTWRSTDKVDDNGYYVQEAHVTVTFIFQEIADLELHGFSHQNVIFDLEINSADHGMELKLTDCFGIGGRILAKRISMTFEPMTEVTA
jgi:hypothetical protein